MLEPLPSLPGISSFPGDRATRPREGSFRCPPLGEFGVGAFSFADYTLYCHVWRAWRGLAAAGGPVALGTAVPARDMLKRSREGPYGQHCHGPAAFIRKHQPTGTNFRADVPHNQGVHTTKIEALVRSRLVSFHGRVARRVHSPRREENQPTVSDMKFVRAGVLSCALYGSNWWYLMKGDLNACRSQICDASCSPGECGSSTLSSEHRQKHQEHTVSVREKENAYNL